MKQKSKTYIRPIVIVMIFAFITIGYAYLTSVLNINGSTLIKNPTWDVHFENVQVKDGSVTGEQVTQEPEIDTNKTTVSFHVNLKKPGDFYEFTVDAVNAGTIDAMINTITGFELTTDQLKYLETSITYVDGEEIIEKQELLAGDTAIYKIVVSFKKDISEDDLPDTPDQLDLTYSVEYVQKDDTAIERKAERTLYNVLKKEYDNNGVALKYSGSHQDSMDTSLSTKDIYYWHVKEDEDGDTIINKNNVIFANHCWQMVRTTDTGGVKLIYNGEVENDMCMNNRSSHVGYGGISFTGLYSSYWFGTDYTYDKNTNSFSLSGTLEKKTWNETTAPSLIGKYTCKSGNESDTCSTVYYIKEYISDYSAYVLSIVNDAHYSQYGRIPFSYESNSPAYVGYMYNDVYPYHSKKFGELEDTFDYDSINMDYWYSDQISISGNDYTLVNPFKISSSSEYQNLVGKYTVSSTDANASSTIALYIADVLYGNQYYFVLSGGETLVDENYVYTYGDSFAKNGDGTYSINNPSTFYRTEWLQKYEDMDYKYICRNAVGNKCNELWYIVLDYPYQFSYIDVNNSYKYANSFTYANGKYTLSGNSSTLWNINDDTNINKINNMHYTCWNESGECTNISYVYSIGYSGVIRTLYYINLSNGTNIGEALNEMLSGNNLNVHDSTMKVYVEKWYAKYMLNYDSYIEDVIYCNNRTITELNGWNPNGGDIRYYMQFENNGYNTNLGCQNVYDRFSTNNPIARTNYKVGLITAPEMNLLYDYRLLDTQQWYYLMSPSEFDYFTASGNTVTSGGSVMTYSNDSNMGLRPAISLRPGVVYESGDGSQTNPYYIKTE